MNAQDSQNYVPVYTAYGQLAGEMVRLMLEAMDIPARMLQESAGTVYGLTVGPLGEVTILVPQEFESAALEVLQAMEEGKLEAPEGSDSSAQPPSDVQNKIDPEENFTKQD